MRSIRTKIELLAAGLVCLGCNAKVAPPIGEDRDVPPQRGGTLRTAFFTDVRSLDAATAFDTASAAIESLICWAPSSCACIDWLTCAKLSVLRFTRSMISVS